MPADDSTVIGIAKPRDLAALGGGRVSGPLGTVVTDIGDSGDEPYGGTIETSVNKGTCLNDVDRESGFESI